MALGETVKVFEGILNRNYEVTDASQKTRKEHLSCSSKFLKLEKQLVCRGAIDTLGLLNKKLLHAEKLR